MAGLQVAGLTGWMEIWASGKLLDHCRKLDSVGGVPSILGTCGGGRQVATE